MRPNAKTPRLAALRLEMLDDRCVPAVIDLTTVGSVGSVGGVFYQQFDSSETTAEDVDPFLRLRGSDPDRSERGYNTDGRLEFDAVRANGATRALPLSEVPVIDVAGVDYRELILDVRERAAAPLISLDELKLYMDDSNTLRNYRGNGTLGNLQPVYNLDAGGDSWVVLDDRLNSTGYGDMRVLIPDSVLTGGDFVYVYSNFGAHNPANGGAEEWAVMPPVVPPPPPPGNSSIGGLVFSDSVIQNDQQDDGEDALANRVVFLDENDDGLLDDGEVRVTTDVDGNYSFTGLAAGTYMVWVEVTSPESTHGYLIDLAVDEFEPLNLAVLPSGGGT